MSLERSENNLYSDTDRSAQLLVRLTQLLTYLLTYLVSKFLEILLDFETAAIAAFREVFAEGQVKGCLFHYCQAVHRNVGQNGLENVYTQVPPYDTPEYHGVRRWVQRLRALPLVPPDMIRVVWNDCLTNPPWTDDPVVDGNLRAFRDYFKNTWLPNRAKLDLCNHWHTQRTRTTNHAEGYHNGLGSAFETRRNAPLGVFLGVMQSVHNEIRVRVRQLQRGTPPNQPLPQYAQNEVNIQLAKDSLEEWLLTVHQPALENLPPGLLLEEHEERMHEALQARLLIYLDRMQHLIA